ncbi:hypothetical protein ON010_g11786 [Phytophthora cinnamomi]|nr:hypothetical protein ON010_g11786 [Phytophthora cinnamomi]
MRTVLQTYRTAYRFTTHFNFWLKCAQSDGRTISGIFRTRAHHGRRQPDERDIECAQPRAAARAVAAGGSGRRGRRGRTPGVAHSSAAALQLVLGADPARRAVRRDVLPHQLRPLVLRTLQPSLDGRDASLCFWVLTDLLRGRRNARTSTSDREDCSAPLAAPCPLTKKHQPPDFILFQLAQDSYRQVSAMMLRMTMEGAKYNDLLVVLPKISSQEEIRRQQGTLPTYLVDVLPITAHIFPCAAEEQKTFQIQHGEKYIQLKNYTDQLEAELP